MKKLLILLLLVSCAKEVDDLGFRVYTIPVGKHSSGSFLNHPDNSRISFQFILDESAYYETEIPVNIIKQKLYDSYVSHFIKKQVKIVNI